MILKCTIYFTSEYHSNYDRERIVEQLGADIDSLKDDVLKAEREVSDFKKMIREKEEIILTLQLQCEQLDEKLKIAENAKVQDELLISWLKIQKRDLINTLRQIKAELEHDNVKLKEALENSLRNEAALRKKMETMEVESKNILRHEKEALKDMKTKDAELKNQMKQKMDRIMNLEEILRQYEKENLLHLQHINILKENELIHNLQVVDLKQRNVEKLELMTSKIKTLNEKQSETEKENQRLNSIIESLQRGNVKSSKQKENPIDNRADKTGEVR